MITWSKSITKIQGMFEDELGNICLIQEGNLANPSPVLRLGVFTNYDDEVNTPMKLNTEQIKELIPLLEFFVEHECLPSPFDEKELM